MPKPDNELLIGVVGNCASGKTTLVQGLHCRGYRAVNIPQEHSVTPRFWRKLNVDFLVVLSCKLVTAQARRQIPWGQERLDQQAVKLADAKAHCQLYLPTDDFSIEEVLESVITAITAWQRGER
ncbi:MAG TPA: hypothetical protein DDZ53_12720 [Firmicutes bacterium]|jgi:hypothetical protein|nr:hypothetical protein [Bacillota bacterium]